MSKKLKITLIIIAAAMVLGVAAFFIFKDIWSKREIPPADLTATTFKIHLCKTITESDLNDIKEIANNATGNKVLNVSISDFPLPKAQYILDENGENMDIDVGDMVVIEFSFLTDEEFNKMFTEIVRAYDLEKPYMNDLFEKKDK